uniref:Uncharacterized protein n=1 Tax=Oryza meridionalis TaxID=40149 RepID=A0A0E0EDC5_9ORYZ
MAPQRDFIARGFGGSVALGPPARGPHLPPCPAPIRGRRCPPRWRDASPWPSDAGSPGARIRAVRCGDGGGVASDKEDEASGLPRKRARRKAKAERGRRRPQDERAAARRRGGHHHS